MIGRHPCQYVLGSFPDQYKSMDHDEYGMCNHDECDPDNFDTSKKDISTIGDTRMRVTDEQIQAALACRLDDDCSRCPFVEAHIQKEKSCNDLQCTDFDAYKDLQDARAQLAIAVQYFEELMRRSDIHDCHRLANGALREIQG